VNGVVRAALISLCVLVVGIVAVHLEVEDMRRGIRIRDLLKAKEAGFERIRRLEIRYNRMVSPDILEQRLDEDFGPLDEPAPGAKAGA
jgi:hypothetical protein